MIYVALLRGINVGGNSLVDMKQLKAAFEKAGMSSVTTYINSGNVIFVDKSHTPQALVQKLEKVIEKEFGFVVKVLLRDIHNIKAIVAALPDTWKNDATMKCDVMFLWEAVDSPAVVDQLTVKPGIDDVQYAAGALLWRVDRNLVTRSGMLRIIGTPLYAQMTIRNCNTARKLLERMNQLETPSTATAAQQ
jgi:uncharacterized protein (DUF1697 family)